MGKRKRASFRSVADIDVERLSETPDDVLASLSVRIKGEVKALQSLEWAIDEDASDAGEPVAAAYTAAAAEADLEGEDRDTMPQQRVQDDADFRWQKAAGAGQDSWDDAPENAQEDGEGEREVGSYVCNAPDDVVLRAQLRRARDRRSKKRKKDFSSFNLETVNDEIVAFLDNSADSGGLELPDFSKMQRLQVRALAAVYGLEPRACGRTGQTLFRTERTGALTNEGLAQVQRLLACSVPSGKPTPELKRELEEAMRSSRAALTRPIKADNKGSLMLRQMGWSEGSGLGVSCQGRTEPIPLHLGQRRQGLGR